MAYTANTPQANDRISDTQDPILNNFINLPTLIEANHVGFDGSADEGKHKFVTLPVQAASPPVGAFSAGETGFYSFLNAITTKNEIYANVTHQATVRQVPASASFLSINSAPGNNSEGWSYLPSGVLMRWGQGTGNSVVTVTYATGAGVAPAFTEVFTVLVTPVWGATTADVDFTVRIIDFNASQFRVLVSKRTTVGNEATNRFFNFIAIGR